MRYSDLVKKIQNEMNKQGESLSEDGIPGPLTQAALAKFDVSLILSKSPPVTLPDSAKVLSPIVWARGELGQKEIAGVQDNPRIRWYHTHCANIGSIEHPDEVPWCSSFLNAAADECGMEKTDNALAVSWKNYGEDSGDDVEEGDIVVIGSSHVTLANKPFNRRTSVNFEGLGGNQGNEVKISIYAVSSISAVRKWKPKYQSAPLPKDNDLEPALDMIKEFEGLYLNAYLDPVGIPTIGWGTIRYPNGQKVQMGDKITKEQASEYLMHEVQGFVTSVKKLVKVPISNNAFCALVSFCYNLGAGALGGSTLLKKLNGGESMESVAGEFGKWVYAGGQVLPGLVRRREAERKLFLS